MSSKGKFQKASVHVGPNMTPMVDIVMCILIFFMLGSTFAMPDLFLPNNTPAMSNKGLGTQNVSGNPPAMQMKLEMRVIGNDTKLVAFGQMYDVTPAAMPGLAELLASKKAGFKSDDVQFIIMPDTVIKYQDVITVYDACMKARLKSVAFASPRH